MHIRQEDNSKLGSFYIEETGNRIADLHTPGEVRM